MVRCEHGVIGMQYARYFLWAVCLLHSQPAAWAGGRDLAHVAGDFYNGEVRRNYLNTSRFLVSSYAVSLEGTPQQVMRISAWLDEIGTLPIGRETLDAILASGNHLTIRHSQTALQASGRTLAPVTDDLTNGLGADVEILFDARIPEQGSHWVFDAAHNAIEFTAVQNLFHELAHARHLVNGTWRYFDSEGQAIEEENVFRMQASERRGLKQVSQRAAVDGRQIWWPDNDSVHRQ
jgi:hypothetical protein